MEVKKITIGPERTVKGTSWDNPISGGHKVYFELADGTILRTNMQFVTPEDKAAFEKAHGRKEVEGE